MPTKYALRILVDYLLKRWIGYYPIRLKKMGHFSLLLETETWNSAGRDCEFDARFDENCIEGETRPFFFFFFFSRGTKMNLIEVPQTLPLLPSFHFVPSISNIFKNAQECSNIIATTCNEVERHLCLFSSLMNTFLDKSTVSFEVHNVTSSSICLLCRRAFFFSILPFFFLPPFLFLRVLHVQ